MRKQGSRKKLKKPYPGFPLFYHQCGQWCKKIGGKLRYFGTEAKDALKKYKRQRADLEAGREPEAEGITLAKLVDEFLNSKKLAQDANELTARTWNDYYRQCQLILSFFGRHRQVASLVPTDFDAFRAELAKKRNATSMTNAIVRTRSLFKWAKENNFIEQPVSFGSLFRQPSAKTRRRARREAGSRVFEAEVLRLILEEAKQPLRSMIFLGINCAFGQGDCATLPFSALDLEHGWITFPRPKTEIERRCPLWLETIASLQKWLARRPPKVQAGAEDLVFVTHRGAPFIRKGESEGKVYFNDYVGVEFSKLLKRIGVKGRGSFYNLRHTFRTAADSARDKVAIDIIMGHADPSMGAMYREDERIADIDQRLQNVVDLVRCWLWPVPLLPGVLNPGS